MTVAFPPGGVGRAGGRGKLGFVLRGAWCRRLSTVRRRRVRIQAVTLADNGYATIDTSETLAVLCRSCIRLVEPFFFYFCR